MKSPLWKRSIGDLVDSVIIRRSEDRKVLHIAVPECFFSMLAGQIIGYIIVFLLFGEI